MDPKPRVGLTTLFYFAERSPWLLRFVRPLAVRLAVACSDSVRSSVGENAKRIFGRELDSSEIGEFTRAVVRNFYDFVIDVGQSGSFTAQQLRDRIESVEGIESYHAARAQRR